MTINPWVKTGVVTALGGGIAGIFSAAMDPAKYQFPQDLGSGKMWKYCFMGMALTLGGMLLKSPIGQKTLTAFKDSQQQLQQAKEDIEKVQAELKESTKPK
jgi:hypothetical protein